MSQAEDLLNSLSEPTTYASNDEQYIVIGDDRFITVPDSLKRIAVQYDHDIETVTFDCPRYWDDHDMSQMQVYINYLLPNSTTGQYLAQNVSARGQRMTFDWTISNNVTQYRGNLSFLVCVKRTNSEGNEERHWNSELNRDLYVSEGLECTQTIISNHPDIITQLLTRMDSVEALATPEAMQAYADTWLEENHDSLLAEIQNKGEEVLASIPADYSTTATLAEEGARNKATAIEQTAEGETIFINDSADAYLLGLNLYGKTTQVKTTGKQLLNNNGTTTTLSGMTFTPNADGSISISGTSTNEAYYLFDFRNDIPVKNTELIASISGSDGVSMVVGYFTDTDVFVNDIGTVNSRVSKTLTYPEEAIQTRTFLAVSTGKTINATVYPLLRLATIEDDSYEPYSGGVASPSPEWPQPLSSIENPFVNIHGKNLLKNQIATGTVSGITRTLLNDGRVMLNGTATELHGVAIGQIELYDGEYKASGYISNASLDLWGKSVANDSWVTIGRDTGAGIVFKADGTKYSRYLLQYEIKTGTTFENTILCPMICVIGSSSNSFEPYVEVQNASLTRTLHGLPVASGGNYTDSDGQQWICDEIDLERGVLIQRIKHIVLDGSNKFDIAKNHSNEDRYLYTVYSLGINTGIDGRGYCSSLPYNTANTMNAPGANTIETSGYSLSNSYSVLYLNVGYLMTENSVEALRALLAENPITLLAALKTPIETPLTAEELTNFKMVRSNYPNTTILNDAGAHMTVKYSADTKKYIDARLGQSVASVLEAIENGTY